MSVEAIVRAVEVTAAAEADAIIAVARTDAARVVAAAEAAADVRIREACERADPGFRAEAMRRVNTARLRLLERRAARSAELVNAATDAAQVRLAGIAADAAGPRWTAALGRLLEETAALIGPHGTMRVRAVDLATARPVAARLGCPVEPFDEGTGDDVPGVIGRSADGRVEVDATLPVRLAHARIRFAERVAHLLGVDA
jgi:vacuolar-type H+-ATPase subunit E/Vma4